MKKSIIVVMCLMLLVSGCAGGPVDVPYSLIAPPDENPQNQKPLKAGSSIINADGNIADIGTNTSNTLVRFSDSRVASEAIIASTLKHRDTQVRLAHTQSGTTVEFELVEVSPGVKIQMIKKLTSRETAKFDNPLPIKPSDHPGWEVAKSLGHDLMIGTIVWKGMDTLGGMFKTLGAAKVGDTYNGPVVNSQSNNTAGTSQQFDGSGAAYHMGNESTELAAESTELAATVTP